MDSIKEIFEAMGQRIRSPFWGYVFIAFVLLNWKVLFYLLFAQADVPTKFNFFDSNTNGLFLYVLPVVSGIAATVSAPYISEYSARWAENPVTRRRLREVDAAHQVLQAKNKFATERENERAIHEQSLIDQAKRDEQILEIDDPVTRDALARKVQDARESESHEFQIEAKDTTVEDPFEGGVQFPGEAKQLLLALAENTRGGLVAGYEVEDDALITIIFLGGEPSRIDLWEHRRTQIKYSSALIDLRSKQLIVPNGKEGLMDDPRNKHEDDVDRKYPHLIAIEFVISESGYRLVDHLESAVRDL